MTCHGDEGRRRVFLPIGGETDAARPKGAERGESVCVCEESGKKRQGRRLWSVPVLEKEIRSTKGAGCGRCVCAEKAKAAEDTCRRRTRADGGHVPTGHERRQRPARCRQKEGSHDSLFLLSFHLGIVCV